MQENRQRDYGGGEEDEGESGCRKRERSLFVTSYDRLS